MENNENNNEKQRPKTLLFGSNGNEERTDKSPIIAAVSRIRKKTNEKGLDSLQPANNINIPDADSSDKKPSNQLAFDDTQPAVSNSTQSLVKIDDWEDIWKIKPSSEIKDLNEIEAKLHSIITSTDKSTLTRGDRIASFIEELDEEDKKVAIDFLHKKIKDEFNFIKQKICVGIIDLLRRDGFDFHQMIMTLIYGRYAYTEEIKKIFCVELASFYKDLIKNETLEAKTKENLHAVTNNLFTIAQTDRRMSIDVFANLKKEKIISEEQSGFGELPKPDFDKFPQLNSYPNISESVKDAAVRKEITKTVYKIKRIIEQINDLRAFFKIKEHILMNEDWEQNYISNFKNLKDEFDLQQKKVLELQRKTKETWLKRIFSKKKKETAIETEKYFNDMLSHIKNLWENTVSPAYILFGNVLLGKKPKS